eukprot:SAG22_NODE_101_length_20519_cov_15.588002_27_plen_41_part_00
MSEKQLCGRMSSSQEEMDENEKIGADLDEVIRLVAAVCGL